MATESEQNRSGKKSGNPGSRNSQKKPKVVVEKAPVELATAVILLELSAAESRTSIHQKGIIQGALRALYGLSEEASIAIMQQAQNTLRSMRGSSAFADSLRDQLDPNSKQFLLKVMDDVVRTDGSESDMEIYLRNRFRALMGVPETQFKEAPKVSAS